MIEWERGVVSDKPVAVEKNEPRGPLTCRFQRFPFVFNSDRAALETRNGKLSLSLGDRCRWGPFGLYRHRRHVFAAGPAPTDRAGYRLVGHGCLQRHDRRLSRDGAD